MLAASPLTRTDHTPALIVSLKVELSVLLFLSLFIEAFPTVSCHPSFPPDTAVTKQR